MNGILIMYSLLRLQHPNSKLSMTIQADNFNKNLEKKFSIQIF